MIVKIGTDKKYYCDVCGEETDDISEFEITFDYGSEDSCYGCHDGEHELMQDLSKDDDGYDDLASKVREYLSQNILVQCRDCRDNGCDHYISLFEDAFRTQRVSMVKKLAANKLLPEFLDDKTVKKERIAHWEKRKQEVIEDMKKGLSDFGYENKSQELVGILRKIVEYKGY